MPKSRLPKRLMLSWVQEPRIAGGQEMTFGRSLERHLQYVGLTNADGTALAFTEWAHLAQDRVGWYKLVTKPPFALGKPFVRQPRGDTRLSMKDKQRLMEQRDADIVERRAALNDTASPPQPQDSWSWTWTVST